MRFIRISLFKTEMDFVLTFQNLLNIEVEHLSCVATGELIVSAREIWAPASEAAPSGAQAPLKVVKGLHGCPPVLPSSCADSANPPNLAFPSSHCCCPPPGLPEQKYRCSGTMSRGVGRSCLQPEAQATNGMGASVLCFAAVPAFFCRNPGQLNRGRFGSSRGRDKGSGRSGVRLQLLLKATPSCASAFCFLLPDRVPCRAHRIPSTPQAS